MSFWKCYLVYLVIWSGGLITGKYLGEPIAWGGTILTVLGWILWLYFKEEKGDA